MMFELQVLPVEILSIILNHKYLNGWGGILRLVCKRWNSIVKSQKIHLPNVYLTVTLYKHATEIYVDKKWYESDIIEDAAKVGSIEVIEWAKTKGLWIRPSVWACVYAATNGHLECLKYLHENGCPWDERTFSTATLNGHLECLKYLHENGCPWDESACNLAAENGHLECLKYLHESGCSWDKWTFSTATLNGHLECLKYLHENGCPWDEHATKWAARHGHLECLKYLRENGCPWDKQECLRVANFRNNSGCYEYIENA